MARTRLNPRLTKIHLAYTLAEVAELYGLHVNTVRGWIKRDGLEPIDGRRPLLIKGSVLRAFLDGRRKKA
ncbi:MAG: helix-turn-helix domain-containing protein, partial [Phenylobacterium sp.]|nr:helix-turn-helix domain-containing protein [Phenylobacterium sp.]